MRLTEQEKAAIVRCAKSVFGENCVVRLFGSRVDDRRRGGDIDLHVVADARTSTLRDEIAFKLALADAFGERRVDVLLRPRTYVPRPIDRIAVGTGVELT